MGLPARGAHTSPVLPPQATHSPFVPRGRGPTGRLLALPWPLNARPHAGFGGGVLATDAGPVLPSGLEPSPGGQLVGQVHPCHRAPGLCPGGTQLAGPGERVARTAPQSRTETLLTHRLPRVSELRSGPGEGVPRGCSRARAPPHSPHAQGCRGHPGDSPHTGLRRDAAAELRKTPRAGITGQGPYQRTWCGGSGAPSRGGRHVGGHRVDVRVSGHLHISAALRGRRTSEVRLSYR